MRYLWRHQPLVATVADKARALRPRALGPWRSAPLLPWLPGQAGARADELWPISAAHAQLLTAGLRSRRSGTNPADAIKQACPPCCRTACMGVLEVGRVAAAGARGGRGRTRVNVSAFAPLVGERMLVAGQRPAGCVARSWQCATGRRAAADAARARAGRREPAVARQIGHRAGRAGRAGGGRGRAGPARARHRRPGQLGRQRALRPTVQHGAVTGSGRDWRRRRSSSPTSGGPGLLLLSITGCGMAWQRGYRVQSADKSTDRGFVGGSCGPGRVKDIQLLSDTGRRCCVCANSVCCVQLPHALRCKLSMVSEGGSMSTPCTCRCA